MQITARVSTRYGWIGIGLLLSFSSYSCAATHSWSTIRLSEGEGKTRSLPIGRVVPVPISTEQAGKSEANPELTPAVSSLSVSSQLSFPPPSQVVSALVGPALPVVPMSSLAPEWHDSFTDDLTHFRESILKAINARLDRVTPLLQSIQQSLPSLPEDLRKKVSELFNFAKSEQYQPQKLIREDCKLKFLLEATPRPDHPFLSPLNARIRALQDFEIAVSAHPSLKELLRSLREHYQSFVETLCRASPDERTLLLSLVRLQVERCESYFISEEDAHHLLCTDLYALPGKPTETGSSPVVGFKGVHFKKNIKKSSGDSTLNPSMEWAMYAFHQLLVGQGVPPSTLLVVRNVPHKVPQENTQAFKRFTEAADRSTAAINRKTAEHILSNNPELQEELKSATQDYVVQASRTIRGKTLAKFIEENQNLDDIDPASFSALMIASLLTNPADGKPDNYMLEEILPRMDHPRYRLVSIDNDWVLANMIVRSERTPNHHFLEAKTILYCLRSLMDRPVDEGIRTQLLNHSPDVLMLQWVTSLQQQARRYHRLLQQGVLARDVYEGLSLPLRFYSGMLVRIRDTLTKIQVTLRRSPTLSHQELLSSLYPLVARYYGTVQEDPLKAFRAIYSQASSTALERVLSSLDPEEVQESLKAENAQADAYKNRTQSLEEATHQLLQTVDLATHSPQIKTTLLELGLSHWRDQATRVTHPSWHDPLLYHHLLPQRPSLPVIEFLLHRLPPEAVNSPNPFDGERRTPLHLAVLYGGSHAEALIGVLLGKGATLESQDKGGLTPLDYTMREGKQALFTILINKGAGQRVDHAIATAFFRVLMPAKPSYAAFQILRHRNPAMAWHIALETILPTTGAGHRVQSVSLEERVIPSELATQLINTEGKIIPYDTEKRRRTIGRITAVDQQIYFKVYPELPGLEEAVGILTRRILGWGAPHTELLRINGLPVLASYGIQGSTLGEVLKTDPNLLRHSLDPESISSMILMAMITNPEDGKPDNYIVEEILPRVGCPRYRLMGVDNDHAFMPGVAKEPEKKKADTQPTVQVKTILYCIEQMNQPIHPNTRQRFLDFNIGELLEEWVKELDKKNTLYRQLFPRNEEVQAFLEKDCYIGVPFEKEAIERLYSKLVGLQLLLLAKPSLTHWELLRALEPHLAYRYKKTHHRTVSERFKAIDGAFYGPDGSTKTTSALLLKDIGIPLKESLLEIVRKDDLNVVDYRPRMALGTLQEIRAQHSGLTLLHASLKGEGKVNPAHMKALKVDQHLVALLEGLDFMNISKPDQEAILQTLQGRALRRLALAKMSALTDALLIKHVRLDNLTVLRLIGCPQLTSTLLSHLATRAPVLKALTLGGSDKLIEVGEQRLFGAPGQVVFKRLEHLNVTHCLNLTTINLKAPNLQRLRATGCHKLKETTVISDNLQSIYFNNTAITDEFAWRIWTQNLRLQKIDLQGCPNVTQVIRDFRKNLLVKTWDLKGETWSKYIGDDGAKVVANALRSNTTLTHLNLERNWIGETGATAIGEALQFNTTLISLSLADNNIGEAGTTVIGEALKTNRILISLNLGGNQIGSAGIVALADVLKVNHTLISMNLSVGLVDQNLIYEGYYTRVAALVRLVDALKINHTLTSLNLAGNGIGYNGVTTVLTTFAEALKVNRTLKIIDLAHNRISRGGAKIIADALKINHALTNLDISFNEIREAGATALADGLETNRTLTSLSLQCNSISYEGAAIIKKARSTTLIKLDLGDIAAEVWRERELAKENNERFVAGF